MIPTVIEPSQRSTYGCLSFESVDGLICEPLLCRPDLAKITIKNLDSGPNPPAGFTLRDFRFDEATFKSTTRPHALYSAPDANLAPFFESGGRLILWHGLADPHISPMNTVAYYRLSAIAMTRDEATLNTKASRHRSTL